MSNVTCQISISLDGFVAGPNQTLDNPIGEGGMRLHQWAFATDTWNRQHGQAEGERTADSLVAEEVVQGIGAYVMGRNMFGPIRGEWDEEWNGWWGEDPPYHAPVFVLAHRSRRPVEMQGGTTFHFVTDGIESALAKAREAAGERSVAVAGGASTVNQYLAIGAIDELRLHVAPLVFGKGERLFEGVGDITLVPVEATGTELVTHLTYRVVR